VVVLAAVPDRDLGDYDALYETINQPWQRFTASLK
jgi:hypothetical protein